jgi:L-cysteate sulfo-lyase
MAAVQLLSLPTPVEPAPRLAGAIGLDGDAVLLKRDDLIGLGGGGNKVRKLQVTMTAALAARARVVVTTGAPQSNHARLTAAAGARLGIGVVLVLAGEEPRVHRGNLLLDQLFGAEVVFAGRRDVEAVADEIVIDRGAFRIPFGGSSPASAEAYRAAGEELLAQVPDLDVVVAAVGSGGTMAGLVSALGAHRVLGVHTGAVPDPEQAVRTLLEGMSEPRTPLRFDLDRVGAGYEHLTSETRAAMLLAARTEGVVLDPVYTGRAMAGLIAAARSGRLDGQRVVFLHTGGLPGLFGHDDPIV